jgi:hypothetical protein
MWIMPEAIKSAEFLFSGVSVSKPISKFNSGREKELGLVLQKLKAKNHKVYFADLTSKYFKPLNFHTVKVIIPGLQPLYLHEHEKKRSVRDDRLADIASHFGKTFSMCSIKRQKLKNLGEIKILSSGQLSGGKSITKLIRECRR